MSKRGAYKGTRTAETGKKTLTEKKQPVKTESKKPVQVDAKKPAPKKEVKSAPSKAPSKVPKRGKSKDRRSSGKDKRSESTEPRDKVDLDFNLNDLPSIKPKLSGVGVVKSVSSGDTISLYLMDSTNGPPKEKDLTFSLVSAPRLGKRGKPDEPYAWESRELLRQKAIGKKVSYAVEFIDSNSGRHYGFAEISESGEKLHETVVEAGLATVRPPKSGFKPRNKEHATLLSLQERAKSESIGIYSHEPKEKHIRDVEEIDDTDYVLPEIKGKTMKGIIEFVVDGSTMRIYFPESRYLALVRLSGVQCPMYKRKEVYDEETDEKRVEWLPDFCADRAKAQTERLLLNREVDVTIEASDKKGAFFATVLYRSRNISDILLMDGLADYTPWNANPLDVPRFKKYLSDAQDKKNGIWIHQKKKKIDHSDKNFVGRVVDIRSGSAIVVRDDEGIDTEVNFGSINVPKLGGRNSEDEPLAWEAKEWVRKKLIGKKVRVEFDYKKDAFETKSGIKIGPRAYYSVFSGSKHIPTELIKKGLASVKVHRKEESKSQQYLAMMEAEEKARETKTGIFSATIPEVVRILDLRRITAGKAKTYLRDLQKKRRMNAVAEYIYNGARMKLLLPERKEQISVVLVGVTCPATARKDGDSDEPYSREALDFVRDLCHQRHIEVEIEGSDRGGNFMGNVFVPASKHANLATLLLDNGLATIHSSAFRSSYAEEYEEAEKRAKERRINLWKDYDPASEIAATVSTEEEKEGPSEPLKIRVTEVVDGNKFYAHLSTDGSTEENLKPIIEELNKSLADSKPPADWTPAVRSPVAAKFSFDQRWYRAKVVGSYKGKMKVFYVDYGNTEFVPVSSLRPLGDEFMTLPPQAKACSLACLKVPELQSDHGPEAADYLKYLIFGKELVGNIEYQDRRAGVAYLSLGDPEKQIFINQEMVSQGLARPEIRKERHLQVLSKKLVECESEARESNRGVFQYGDFDVDEI